MLYKERKYLNGLATISFASTLLRAVHWCSWLLTYRHVIESRPFSQIHHFVINLRYEKLFLLETEHGEQPLNAVKGTVAVYSENHTKHTNTLRGQNSKFQYVKTSGTYSNNLA
jgi:hypothetical protein